MNRRWAVGSVALGWLLMIGLLWPHRGLVPFWDGWVYARCILDEPGIITRCAWHPALAWTIPMLLAKLGALPGATPLFAPQLVLGLVALVGWARLVAAVLPDDEDRTIRAMLVVALAIHPATLTAVLQPNIDLAVLAWGIWTLGALVRRDVLGMVVFGTLLCFSKETGVLLYGIAAAVCWWSLLRTPSVVRRTVASAVPVVIYAAVVFGPAILAAGQAQTIWGVSNGSPGFLRDFRPWDLWSKQLLNQAFLVTVLQFQWVPTLGIAVGAGLAMRRGRWSWRDLAPTTGWRCLAWTLVVAFYVITSYRTYSNLRYFTIFVPFFALGAIVLLSHAGVARRTRTVALALWLPCLLASVRWSADPVSRAALGTFSIGAERMFRVTRISGECCGYGHDALAYNLQYTGLGRVLDRAMSQLRPGDSTIVVKTRWLGWAWLTALDPVTQRRTLDEKHGVLPPMIEAESLLVDRARPARVWFVVAPNVPVGPEFLAPTYRQGERREVSAGGATLQLIELLRIP
jgi:hypothetical protein